MAEMLRQLAMNQQLIATMLRKMDLEEERRTKLKRRFTMKQQKQAAEAAKTRDPFDLSAAPSLVLRRVPFLGTPFWRF